MPWLWINQRNSLPPSDGQPLILDNEDRYKVHTRVSSTGFASGVISSKLELKDARVTDSGVYLCRSTERAQMAGVKVEVQGQSDLCNLILIFYSLKKSL